MSKRIRERERDDHEMKDLFGLVVCIVEARD